MLTKIFAIFLTIIFCLPVGADVYDMTRAEGTKFVKVTILNKDMVTFQECLLGESHACRNLGPRKSYLIKSLSKQHTLENIQIWASVAVDVGLVVSGTLAVIGLVANPKVGIPAMAALWLTLGTSFVLCDELNPKEQYRQAKTLVDDVIYDRDVDVKNIEEFIYRFEMILNKI